MAANVIARMGHAQTYVSKAVTDRFWVIDRAMFALSPYLTFEEAEQIGMELERMATSKLEGNFSGEDAFNWLAQQLGAERYAAVTQCWNIDNQQAIQRVHSPDSLRDAWVHILTMHEGTPEQVRASPKDYILIKTTKDSHRDRFNNSFEVR